LDFFKPEFQNGLYFLRKHKVLIPNNAWNCPKTAFAATSDFESGRIVGMHKAGFSFRETVWSLNRSHRRPGSGHPRRRNEREDRRLRQLTVKGFGPSAAIGVDSVKDLRQKCAKSTFSFRTERLCFLTS
jgi:hypothetical protein